LLTDAMQARVREQFEEVIAAKRFNPRDVTAGRAYVDAYVRFIHFVEGLYDTTMTAASGHFSDHADGAAQER
jgi:hypothetical protein